MGIFDPFDTLDKSTWGVSDTGGHGSEWLWEPGAFITEGVLQLMASDTQIDPFQWTGAQVYTLDEFLYGSFEVRAKIPRGRGLWPVIWLVEWPITDESLEIDIAEFLGHYPGRVHMATHWIENGQRRNDLTFWDGNDFSAGYYTFELDWTPSRLAWSVDGVVRKVATEHIPHVPMRLLLTHSVGGDWAGEPDASTQFPAFFDIDSVRVEDAEMSVVDDLELVEQVLRRQAAELNAQADAVAQAIMELRAIDDQLDAAAQVIEADA